MWGLNHKLGSPAYSTRTWKGTQKTPSCEKQQGFCLPGRDGCRDTEPLKRPNKKMFLQPLTPGYSRGGESRLETHEESVGLVALGRKLKEQPPGSLCWNHSPYCRGHLSQAEHSSPSSISLKGSNSTTHPPPPGILGPTLGRLIWLEAVSVISLTTKTDFSKALRL